MTAEAKRRYQEIYDWNVKTEKEGRGRMKRATFFGILIAIGWLIFGSMILFRLFAKEQENLANLVLTVNMISSPIAGVWFRQWWYNSGIRMVLSAQQLLVAIDTEQNTRNISEVMARSQAVNT